MSVKFHTEQTDYKLAAKTKTIAWIRSTAVDERRRLGEVNVVFCSDNYLLQMNVRYLGHNYLTDVITFDYSDLAAGVVSGDLFISVDTVADNAQQFGVSAGEEMKRVIIHGILHLCGYGDKTPEEEKTMRAKENRYLAKFPV